MLQTHQRVIVARGREILLVEGHIQIHGEDTGVDAETDVKRQLIVQVSNTLTIKELLVGSGNIVVNDIGGAVLILHLAQTTHIEHLHIGADTVGRIVPVCVASTTNSTDNGLHFLQLFGSFGGGTPRHRLDIALVVADSLRSLRDNGYIVITAAGCGRQQDCCYTYI